MTILWNKRSGKGRVLMRREQILKLCCNHLITEDMELKCHQGKWQTFLEGRNRGDIMAGTGTVVEFRF